MTTDAVGDFVITWNSQDAPRQADFARRFDGDGTALSDAIPIVGVESDATQPSEHDQALPQSQTGRYLHTLPISPKFELT